LTIGALKRRTENVVVQNRTISSDRNAAQRKSTHCVAQHRIRGVAPLYVVMRYFAMRCVPVWTRLKSFTR